MFLISSSSCLMRTSLWLRSSLSRRISSCCLWNFRRSCGQTHARYGGVNQVHRVHPRDRPLITFRLRFAALIKTYCSAAALVTAVWIKQAVSGRKCRQVVDRLRVIISEVGRFRYKSTMTTL